MELLKRYKNVWRSTAILGALVVLLSTATRTLATPEAVDVLAFSFSPTTVNTALQTAAITFTMQLNTSTPLCDVYPYSQVNFMSPSGFAAFALFRPSNLKPGTTDTYVTTMTVDANSEQGTWNLYDVALIMPPQCNATSTTSLYNAYMSSRSFPTTFVVKNSSVLFLPSIFRAH